MSQKNQKPDRREYTLMIVPHYGQAVRSVRIPIKAVRYSLIAVCTAFLLLMGSFANYQHALSNAKAEKSELEQLRQVNGAQVQQIEQLAQATATLQQDMNRLNALDVELRHLVNNEDQTATSRAGVVRPGIATYSGQGGPIAKPQVQDLAKLVQEMQMEVQDREQSLQHLREALEQKNARVASTPSIWPAGGDVTSRFGWRWGSDWHPGIDIANSTGTTIVATADGIVVQSGWSGGYGKLVQIDHGNGIETLYGHNSEIVVDVGQFVKKGQVISYMGNTGYSTGPHVHYEVRVNGTAVNPATFL